MLPNHTKKTPANIATDDHFSPMEDALFRELADDAEIDDILERAFGFVDDETLHVPG